MWWSRKPAVATQGELRRVDAESSQAIADLERRVRDLELDWAQTYEKFATLYARMKKRAKADLERETAQEASGGPIGPETRADPETDRWVALKAAQARRGASA